MIKGTSGPVNPENGRINFSVTANETGPGPQAASFGDSALITITTADTNNIVFQSQIPIN